ncbi:tetratricopeptide repeat family protein [Sporocytophaga myxococcoides]|uniref:Tetratricopeptide repeat family protein n=1 Tax=Sporocytophaga myxococcoides TaxID=153721 RepID=A0A098LAK8_9BACT|nr:tetratricopeptide repeat protein [Sporocytophaga myxococcoides]GAL83472.1 tetratricopeptide repeat family protein [Sporocytophaga myxococcoides]
MMDNIDEYSKEVFEAIIDYGYVVRFYNEFRKLNLALDSDPGSAELFFKRGSLYYDNYKYEEALKDFDKAILINSKYSSCYNSRGCLYGKMKRYEMAELDFTLAIKYSNNESKGIYFANRSACREDLKKYQLSIVDLKKAAGLGHKASIKKLKRRNIKFGEYREDEKYCPACQEKPCMCSSFNP